MKNHHQISINVPDEIYKVIKAKANKQNISFEEFLVNILKDISDQISREDIYEPYLKRKISR